MSFIIVSFGHSVSLIIHSLLWLLSFFQNSFLLNIYLFCFCLLCYHLLCLFNGHPVEAEVSVPCGNVSLAAFFFAVFMVFISVTEIGLLSCHWLFVFVFVFYPSCSLLPHSSYMTEVCLLCAIAFMIFFCLSPKVLILVRILWPLQIPKKSLYGYIPFKAPHPTTKAFNGGCVCVLPLTKCWTTNRYVRTI